MSGLSAALGLAAASAVGRLRRRCCCDNRAVVAFWSVVMVVAVAAAAVWSQLSHFFMVSLVWMFWCAHHESVFST